MPSPKRESIINSNFGHRYNHTNKFKHHPKFNKSYKFPSKRSKIKIQHQEKFNKTNYDITSSLIILRNIISVRNNNANRRQWI